MRKEKVMVSKCSLFIMNFIVIGDALIKEIEFYEKCHPALGEFKTKLVDLINNYNNLFSSKNNFDSTLANFLSFFFFLN